LPNLFSLPNLFFCPFRAESECRGPKLDFGHFLKDR
jgi:hypothetical protein